jgi:serine/threonine-protein kinase
MGVVYKARQLRLNRLVALKLVRPEAAGARVRRPRFLVEGEVLARLQHPNVVRIYDVGFHRGQAYFALELVEGGSLATRLDGKPLPPRRAARLVACLARAVQAAHAQGVVHRDLKPGNVLLTADGVPKLADFGLAKTLDVDLSLTRTGEVLGTPAYMAPEQALGQAAQVGPLTDVYALGVILYEALTGRPPFLAETYQEVLRQVSWSEPVPPRRLQPRVPRDLEIICLRCLQKEPGRRYASAGDLADDLRRYLDNRAILARPSGPVEKLARSCRRNPLPASLLAAIVLVFLPALAGVAWQWRVAEAARVAAVRERDASRWREYQANRAAASGALAANNPAEARRLLEASSPDDRGWERRHVMTRLDGARADGLRTTVNTEGSVPSPQVIP